MIVLEKECKTYLDYTELMIMEKSHLPNGSESSAGTSNNIGNNQGKKKGKYFLFYFYDCFCRVGFFSLKKRLRKKMGWVGWVGGLFNF